MYKTTYAMSKIVSHNVMHGDIDLKNISLKNGKVFEDDEICPIIRGWDFGYHYSDKHKGNNISYDQKYTPPEMFYFKADCGTKKCNKMFVSNGAFKHSKKEDVFALE